MTVHGGSGLERYRAFIERALDRALSGLPGSPGRLEEAMRYSLEAPGKRLRPALCLATCEASGGDPERAEAAAAALELVHTYSLIHDDLPCMDNDDTRRGRPTNHRVYGDALAVLAGDALLTRAFGVLAEDRDTPGVVRAEMMAVLAEAAGARGMVGGQALDFEAERGPVSPEALEEIHARKTGALFGAACRLGALAAGANAALAESWEQFGQKLGLAFQIVDDLLDETGSTAQLGKSAGSDRERGKATYPAVCGLEASRARARQVAEEARELLSPLGERAQLLAPLTRLVVERTS